MDPEIAQIVQESLAKLHGQIDGCDSVISKCYKERMMVKKFYGINA